MRKVNLSQVPVKENPSSSSGRFRSTSQEISKALAHGEDSGPERSAHPFDLELCRVPPGASPWPYHAHSAQSELYLIVAGSGKFRTPTGVVDLDAGDAIHCEPSEPHQIINDGSQDLAFYIIADNPVGDCCYYPDSDKWGLPSNLNGTILRGTAVGYFDGEE
jgi:uncharacterized cupin superfamily protein